jgi:hypothetical protein
VDHRSLLPRLLLFEAATYAIASLVHFGVMIHGFEHDRAGTAEAIIAAVLLVGFAITRLRPGWTRSAAFLVQLFALLGTFVGLFSIVVGFGPRTVPDVVYHAAIVVVLLVGLGVSWHARAGDNGLEREPAS